MKLLIVEDNLPMRRMIRRIVADLADEIDECGDGMEALDWCSAGCPDWVLLDIELPRLNGIAAAPQLKAPCPGSRILMVTNYDDATLREAARQAGASGYVLKDNLLELRQFLRPAGC